MANDMDRTLEIMEEDMEQGQKGVIAEEMREATQTGIVSLEDKNCLLYTSPSPRD